MEKRRTVKCAYCGEHFILTPDMRACPYCDGVINDDLHLSDADADFVRNGSTLIKYTGDAEHIIIPDGIRVIGEDAFACNKKIVSVIFPESLRVICDGAFRDCIALKESALPHDMVELSPYAFAGCDDSLSVSAPSGTGSLDTPASGEETGEPESGESNKDAEDIWAKARFADVRKLLKEAHSIGMSLESFRNAPPRQSVSKDADFIIADGALLSYRGDSADIVIPAGVKRISEGALAFRINLESVVFPDGLEEIAADAFNHCVRLKSLILPNTLRKIGENAFKDCAELTCVLLPESLEEIRSRAFAGCEKLLNARMPLNIKSVADDAFDRR